MDTAAKRLDDAISFLKNSTHELKEGRLVSLDAFQEQVRSICEDLSSVTPSDKAVYAEKLQVLADFLRNFETDLRARQAEVNFELMSLNAKQKALKSYETANHAVKKSDKDGN
jgi:hypothetical protein